VLSKEHLALVKDFLEGIVPMKAVFDPGYVKRLEGTHVKTGTSKMDLAEQLMADIAAFKRERGVERCVAVWCGSTETWRAPTAVHQTLEAFEQGLRDSSDDIAPTRHLRLRLPSLGRPLRQRRAQPLARLPGDASSSPKRGDAHRGQGLQDRPDPDEDHPRPGLQGALLGLDGWYSTNILGNRDGEVLDDPESFKSKEVSKLGVLEHILQPALYPELYGHYSHVVRINYYPPRGDNKEGWDNIDIFGWLNYPMQIKVDFLCRDSILAAPIVLDLALFLDLAAGEHVGHPGVAELLLQEPDDAPGLYPEHDLFIQLMKLKNTLRWMKGVELITHLGVEYYD
jgi:myo-inositol-1-phosphate synthase